MVPRAEEPHLTSSVAEIIVRWDIAVTSFHVRYDDRAGIRVFFTCNV